MKDIMVARRVGTFSALLVVFVLVGCGARQPASPEEAAFMQEAAQADFQIKNTPEWFLKPPAKKGYEYSAGHAHSIDMQLARDKASLHARRRLCDTIAGRVSGQQKLYRAEGGERLDQEVLTSFEETIKSACYEVEIPGWKIADSRFASEGKNIHSWVLIEYSKKSVNSLGEQLRGSDAFEDLERDIKSAREADAQ